MSARDDGLSRRGFFSSGASCCYRRHGECRRNASGQQRWNSSSQKLQLQAQSSPGANEEPFQPRGDDGQSTALSR
jgi:hypothetical protein